ncbi:MAG: Ig-like domain-containing protein [Candidatus Bathyarchaeia archaeon]|jgi:hypothetical protein
MKFKGITLVAFTVITLLVLSCFQASSASPLITLSLYKNNGYGMGNDMNGDWTLNAAVSEDVTRVEFYFDGHLVANETTAPYSWHFNTSNYTSGLHLFEAKASNEAGESALAQITRNFVPFPLDFVVGIIGLIIVTLIIAVIGAVIRAKKLGVKLRKS